MTRTELEKICFEAFPTGKIENDLFLFGTKGRINLAILYQLHDHNLGVLLDEEVKSAIKQHVEYEKKRLEMVL